MDGNNYNNNNQNGLRIPSIHTITAARAISRQNMQMKET